MGYPIKGDLDVCRSINAARRVNQGLTTKTITAAEALTIHSAWWQRLSAATAQDVVLPDATTLAPGWTVMVNANGAANLDVKTYHATTPVSRKVIQPGQAYRFTLVDNGDAAGTWYVDYISESAMVASDRYVESFTATTEWGSAVGGVYTQTIAAGTHGRGASPDVTLYEESGSDFIEVTADVKVLASGDVEISVPENPDCRFAGKAVFI